MNVRVDTSVWVPGELALGGVTRNLEVSTMLGALPRAPLVSRSALLGFIAARLRHGRDVGYVDAQLLASVCLGLGSTLWIVDKGLRTAASALGLAHDG